MRLKFSVKHFCFFVILFLIEVLIAVFVKDRFVRPFVGDTIVVLLMYSFIRAFFAVKNEHILAICILLFAYLVEVGQYFNLVSKLGLANSKIAATAMGSSFDWIDLIAYTIGFMLILVGVQRKRTV